MKIGLYTIHATNNVGAMLQAYALIQVLRNLGAEVELVNLYTRDEEAQNHNKRKTSFIKGILRTGYILLHPKMKQMEINFDDFHALMPLSKRYFTPQEYIERPNIYDIHLIGSDQVWNLQKGFDFARFFFLDYLPKSSVKISYSASFGTTSDVKDANLAANAIKWFKKISVREDRAVEFVQGLVGKKCSQVVDPTLLLNKAEWTHLIGDKPFINGRYILFYGVNRDRRTWEILKEAKRLLNVPIVGYPGPIPSQYNFDDYILNGGPKEFVNIVNNADLIVTSSFHGLAFAVNFGKKFIIAKYGGRMERLESLIRLVGATDNVAENKQDVNRILQLKNDQVISNNLKCAREKSLEWIKHNIIDFNNNDEN